MKKKTKPCASDRTILRGLLPLSWPRDRERIKDVENRVLEHVRITPLEKPPSLVAGVDAAFLDDKIITTACVYTYPGLEPVEERYLVSPLEFPYIPGYLSFREGPAIIDTICSLRNRPDLVIFDGQGIAHPRGLGIASFVGAILDLPSIGCAKSRLVGEYEEPGPEKGSRTPLLYRGNRVGAVLRTRDRTRPVFVSPGHRTDIEGSVEVVLGCVDRFRLAEPVRRADQLSKEIKRGLMKGADEKGGRG